MKSLERLQKVTHIDNVCLSEDGCAVVILDQTQLPCRTVYRRLETAAEMYDAIFELQVRGAPAIGICAGYCMYCLAQQIRAEENDAFYAALCAAGEKLNAARPTAVNLAWAIRRMLDVAKRSLSKPREALLETLHGECVAAGMLPMSSPEVRARIAAVLRKYSLPTHADCGRAELLDFIRHDKKACDGGIVAVFVEKIGSFEFRRLTIDEIGKYMEAGL